MRDEAGSGVEGAGLPHAEQVVRGPDLLARAIAGSEPDLVASLGRRMDEDPVSVIDQPRRHQRHLGRMYDGFLGAYRVLRRFPIYAQVRAGG